MTRRENIFFALLCTAPFIFLSCSLLSSETFFARDLTYLFHPWRTLSSQMIQTGEMPLWNSYELGGMPFLANCQSSILYPFTIIFASLGFAAALKLFYVAHYALAGIGFYLFSRKLRFNGWISLIGSILFAYNGYSLTRLEFLSILGTMIWFPWILLFILSAFDNKPRLAESERAASSNGVFQTNAILCGIVICFSLFGGFPQVLILQIAAALLFSFLMNPSRKTILFWALALSVILFIGTAQWLPTLELLKHSIRSGSGVAFDEASTYSFPVYNLCGLLNPFYLTPHQDQYTNEKFFWIWSAWWGITASLFALCSFKTKQKKLALFACVMGCAGFIWSLGDQTSLYGFLYKYFFVIRLFRYPPAALYWTTSAAAILLLCGMQALHSQFWPKRIKTVILVVGGLLVSAELWYYGRNILPTINPQYYHVTFKVVEKILRDNPATVMLSPKVNQVRRLPGAAGFDTRVKFRGMLYDLTNLPYRIKTIIPCGEPLALKSYNQLYHKLTAASSFTDARPILDLWNVTHLVTDRALDASWELLLDMQGMKVYRNLQSMGGAFAVNKEKMVDLRKENRIPPEKIVAENSTISALFNVPKESVAVFNVPYYPGWKLFCEDCKVHGKEMLDTCTVLDYFCGAVLPPGTHRLRLVYRPALWPVAATLSLTAVLFLFFAGFRKIKRTLRDNAAI